MTIRPVRSPRPAPILCTLLLVFVAACRSGDSVPEPGSDAYQQAVTAFYTSVAAIQAGSDVGADDNLLKVTELAPGEPAAWANLGLLALRRNELDVARERLQRAAELAPQNSNIQLLLARLESHQGDYDQAVQHLQKAIELDPENVKARYALAQEIEREAGARWEARVQQLLGEMIAQRPDNLALLLESVRLAARQGDRDLIARRITQIDSLSADWPPEVTAQLDALHAAASSGDVDRTATQSIFLRNALLRLPEFRQDIDAIQTPAQQVGDLITHFLRMQQPETTVAEADLQLSFTPEELATGGAGPWTGAGAIWLTGEGDPVPVATSDRSLLIGDETLPLPDGIRFIAPLDYNYDFKTDLAVAGPGGLRLFKQAENGSFQDATSEVRLPSSIAGGSYTGVWAADVDLEGDIDLVLGTQNGPPLVLRNNIGEAFEPIHPFDGVSGLRGFAWADFDGDGDPDAALIDGAGSLHVIVNDRNGIFHPQALPREARQARAITVGDVASNGSLDLVVLS
ncbi:MAG TPA: FG-GAP-like repeat-containing protein, partial [Rhodothermales bacterium]|nr:FG-GAP-like repeat-containing protein [Rhodothermales bacterium]